MIEIPFAFFMNHNENCDWECKMLCSNDLNDLFSEFKTLNSNYSMTKIVNLLDVDNGLLSYCIHHIHMLVSRIIQS